MTMTLSRRALLVSLLLCLSACGADDDRATSPSRTPGGLRPVSGRVTDFATGAPLPNVALAFGTDVQVLDRTTTTDANGAFSIGVPAGRLTGAIAGVVVADLVVHAGGPRYRGDLLGNGGTCVSRYGLITDAVTFQPVSGATVRLGSRSMVTGSDGWYRLDLGCDLNPLHNSGTALIYVSHPGYREFSRVVGRGIHFVNRLDVDLVRP
jgi:hypothetical protein